VTLAAHADSLGRSNPDIARRMENLGYRRLNASTISRYLSGEIPIPEAALLPLASALSVPASAISAETEDDEESDLAPAV
jgi:transcriptional regulator with XRE-family HTH domain